jgi:hypothetical protein
MPKRDHEAKLLNGVLGGAATVAVLYLFGAIGLLA